MAADYLCYEVFMCNRKVSKLFLFYIFINNQCNTTQHTMKVKYSMIFVSDRGPILSYEQYACFDSEVLSVVTEFSVHLLVTGACQSISIPP